MITSAAVAALLGGVSAYAQDANDAETVDEEDRERITVTGSRVKRAGFDTLQPATVVTGEFLELRAATNVADVLNELPNFGIPGSANTDDQGSFNVGQEFVNFFGLGSQRTLTLVNGRRFVSSNPPTLFADAAAGLQVDLNNIPVGLIERVETIAVGGAPIYGADAIAGTVNIILKDDFQGFETSGRVGMAEVGDANTYLLRALMGGNFDDGRGNAVLSMEYTKEDGLLQTEREFFSNSGSFQPGSCGFARCYISDPAISSITAGGLPSTSDTLALFAPVTLDGTPDGTPVQFGPGGNLIPYDFGTPAGVVFSSGGDGLRLSEVESIKAPLERILVSSFAHYDLSDRITAFAEAMFANSRATEQANQPFYNTALFPGTSSNLRFSIDNPYLTAQARGVLAANGLSEFFLSRGSFDLSPREQSNEVNVFRTVFGFQGDFDAFGKTWDWDASYNLGRSRADSTGVGLWDEAFFNAIDAVVDPATGEIVCRVSLAPTDIGSDFTDGDPDPAIDGCVPLNLFGVGAPSPEAIDFVTGRLTSQSVLTQQIYSANLTGDLFTLPAGPIGAAIGFEYRKEEGNFTVDGFSGTAFGRSAAIEDIDGRFDSTETYAEIVVPLISPEQDFVFDSLTLEAAYRYIDNSRAGGADTWTYGARFRPVEDVELRGNITRSVRAPALVELFLPLSSTFSRANDPCDAANVNENPTRAANCAAEFAQYGITDLSTFQSNVVNATATGVSGGNPNLVNEIADAWTIGAVFRPRWVDGLTVAVDWVDIELEDAITSATLTNIMESCYDSGAFPNTSCGFFSRDANGQVNDFQTGFQNAGFQTFAALTVDAEYEFEVAALPFLDSSQNYGDLRLGVNYFHLDELDISLTGDPLDVNIEPGEIDDPENSAQFNATWAKGPVALFWQVQWTDESAFNVEDSPTAQDIATVDAYWLNNATISYDVNDRLTARFAVNNVFDVDPPTYSDASGSAPLTYDVIGRFYSLQLTSRF